MRAKHLVFPAILSLLSFVPLAGAEDHTANNAARDMQDDEAAMRDTGTDDASRQRMADPSDTDNTRRNERDRDQATKTPMDQGSSATDRSLAAQIRRSVVQDDSLSMNAHNVKIIVENGNVTLRGPVKNEMERKIINDKAQQVLGKGRVMNELEVEAGK